MNADIVAARKKRVILIVLAVPTMILLALALHGIYSDYMRIKLAQHRLKARTTEAEGTVVALHDAWHSGQRVPKETVVFTAASGQQIQFSTLANINDKVGMRIPVWYDPLQPDNYALGDRVFGFSELIFDNAPILVAGLFFLFLVLRVRFSSID